MFEFLSVEKRRIIIEHPELGKPFFAGQINKKTFIGNLRAFAPDLYNKQLDTKIRFTAREILTIFREIKSYPSQNWIGDKMTIEPEKNLVGRLQSVIDSMRQTSFGRNVRGADEETAQRMTKSVDELVLTPFYDILPRVKIKVETTEPVRREEKPNEFGRRYDVVTYARIYTLSDVLTIREDVRETGHVSVVKVAETWNPDKRSRYVLEMKDEQGRIVERVEGANVVGTWERFQYEAKGGLQQYVTISYFGAGPFRHDETTQLKYKDGKPTEGKKIEFWENERTIVRLVKRTSKQERWGCAVYNNPTSGFEYAGSFSVERENIAPLVHIGFSDVTPSERTRHTLDENLHEMMYVWGGSAHEVLTENGWETKHSALRESGYNENDTTFKLPGSKLRNNFTDWARPGIGDSESGMERVPVTLTRVGDNFEIEFPEEARAIFPREIKIREYQRQLANEILYKQMRHK